MKNSLRTILALSALAVACEHAHANVELCHIRDGEISFVKDVKAIPYSRIFLAEDWAAGEPNNKNFPIAHLIAQQGRVFVQAFAVDYFEVSLKSTPENGLYLISNINFPLPESASTERDAALKKFGDGDVSYFLSLADNPSCSSDRDLVIAVYKSHVHLEDIHFRLIDMEGRTDWWK